ncbi:hypothetical protein GCM10009827_006300 [Dactylosporangium maewongense]|uniref:Uncharacterized protein n=1 Tax=Dactylosporangium maewongense TaxID=634393 RepID=A0ABN1ZKF6_9ACTN
MAAIAGVTSAVAALRALRSGSVQEAMQGRQDGGGWLAVRVCGVRRHPR